MVKSDTAINSPIMMIGKGNSGAVGIGVDDGEPIGDWLPVGEGVGVVGIGVDDGEPIGDWLPVGEAVGVGKGLFDGVDPPNVTVAFTALEGINSNSLGSMLGCSRFIWPKPICEVPKDRTLNVKVSITPLPLTPVELSMAAVVSLI